MLRTWIKQPNTFLIFFYWKVLVILPTSFSVHTRGREHPRPGVSTVQNRQGYCNCCHVHYSNLEQVRRLLHDSATDSKEYQKALSTYKISVSKLNNHYWMKNNQFVNCTMYALSRRYPSYLLPVKKMLVKWHGYRSLLFWSGTLLCIASIRFISVAFILRSVYVVKY